MWLHEIDTLRHPAGLTDLSGALDAAINLVQNREDKSRSVMVFLATDGLNNALDNPNNVDRVKLCEKCVQVTGLPHKTR